MSEGAALIYFALTVDTQSGATAGRLSLEGDPGFFTHACGPLNSPLQGVRNSLSCHSTTKQPASLSCNCVVINLPVYFWNLTGWKQLCDSEMTEIIMKNWSLGWTERGRGVLINGIRVDGTEEVTCCYLHAFP